MNKTGIEYTGLCYIGVSANLNPEPNIFRAITRLNALYPLTGISRFYRTKPVDGSEQADYLNGVVSILYSGVVRDLKYNVLRNIESLMGRERFKDTYAARPIDLDILLCGDLIIREPGLVVPDPDIRKRPFLMAALVDLNPELVLPDSRLSLKGREKTPELKQLQVARSFTLALHERFSK